MTENTVLFIGLLLAVIPIITLFVLRRSILLILMKDSRPSRILHYLLLAIFGASLQVDSYLNLLQFTVLLRFFLFFLLLYYAGQFAIVTNNIEDLEADRITNPGRPLVQAQISKGAYRQIGWISLVIALALSLFIGWMEFVTVSTLTLVYFVYSSPPFKFKRYVLFAKFLIGLNSFCAALYGFVLLGGKLSSFPLSWGVFILVPISLMANFIDLKDTEGDRLARIKTLPVLLGQRKASLLIAAFTFFTYLYAGILLNKLYVYLLLAVLSIFHISLFFRRPYQEGPLFILHNGLFFGLIILLLIFK